MAELSPAQTSQLLRPVASNRVSFRRGLAHMEAYEIRAHLNRIFGFTGWSMEALHHRLVREEIGKTTATAIYEAQVRLTIHGEPAAVYLEVGVAGDTGARGDMATVYHRALTSAVASALKRAASNLGDQFGLSLYGDGSTDPIVRHLVAEGQDVQAGARVTVEDMASRRLEARNTLRDQAKRAGLDLAEVAKQFLAVNDVDITQAHPNQVLEFAERIRLATTK